MLFLPRAPRQGHGLRRSRARQDRPPGLASPARGPRVHRLHERLDGAAQGRRAQPAEHRLANPRSRRDFPHDARRGHRAIGPAARSRVRADGRLLRREPRVAGLFRRQCRQSRRAHARGAADGDDGRPEDPRESPREDPVQGRGGEGSPRARRPRRLPQGGEKKGANSLAAPLDLLYKKAVYAKFLAAFGGRLKYLICGASALPLRIARFVVNIGAPLYEGYGLTEASPVISVNSPASSLTKRLEAVPGRRRQNRSGGGDPREGMPSAWEGVRVAVSVEAL